MAFAASAVVFLLGFGYLLAIRGGALGDGDDARAGTDQGPTSPPG